VDLGAEREVKVTPADDRVAGEAPRVENDRMKEVTGECECQGSD